MSEKRLSFIMSVCPSVLMEVEVWVYFENLSRKLSFIKMLHEKRVIYLLRFYGFDHISLSS
jgi:hypothetical protein